MILSVSSESLGDQQLAQLLQAYYSGPVYSSRRFIPSLEAAREQLKCYQPSGYARSRNCVDGNVSELNPYITWGVFTLREVQRAMKDKAPPADYVKLVSELAWKAYFRECHMVLGQRIYRSLEPYKYPAAGKKDELSTEITSGQTGLACIDSIVQELINTGHLHNHKRMWFAAYLIHYAKVEWWHGEALFYRYLLDGEPGPNALSWQWVASTFSAKPYYFNADNMRKNNHVVDETLPFDCSYDELNKLYFAGYGDGSYARRPAEQPFMDGLAPHPRLSRVSGTEPLVLLHAERLSDRAAVLNKLPDAPVLVMLEGFRFKQEQPSFMRLSWAIRLAADVASSLRLQGRRAELMLADYPEEVLTYAWRKQCKSIATADSWHPGTWKTLIDLDESLPVSVIEDEPFARVRTSLRSFSAYWQQAQRQVMAACRT